MVVYDRDYLFQASSDMVEECMQHLNLPADALSKYEKYFRRVLILNCIKIAKEHGYEVDTGL